LSDFDKSFVDVCRLLGIFWKCARIGEWPHLAVLTAFNAI